MNTVKNLFGTLHLWFGVAFGIPAAILGVTGIWEMVVHPLPLVVETERVTTGVDALMAVARNAAPDGAVPQQYIAPAGADEPVTVRFAPPQVGEGGPRAAINIQVDPATSTVIPGQTQPRSSFSRFMHDMHANFLLGREGRNVVAWAGIAMAALAVTGLILWLPRKGQWKRAFLISTSGPTRKILRDLHGAAGIWGLIVFLIVTVTGVLIVYPIGGPPAGAPPGAPAAQLEQAAAVEAYSVDAAIALVRAARPDAVVRNVALPRTVADTYRFNLGVRGEYRNDPPTVATVDSSATKVIDIRSPDQLSANERMALWARALHLGRGGGWTWWILVTLSGVLPVIFCISGIWMWLLKRKNRAAVAAQGSERPAPAE